MTRPVGERAVADASRPASDESLPPTPADAPALPKHARLSADDAKDAAGSVAPHVAGNAAADDARFDSKFSSASDLAAVAASAAPGGSTLSSDSEEPPASDAAASVAPAVPVVNRRRATPHFQVAWSVATEQGFKRGASGGRVPIHRDMEDVAWPSAGAMAQLHRDSARVIERHPLSQLPFQAFVLADGHGGSEAPQFFVPRMRNAIIDVMRSKDWAFEVEDEREAFEGLIIDVFEVLDREYCQNRIELFRVWKETYARDPARRPCDDGCTMVVNVLYRDWLVNCNVGDSRTVLGSQLRSPGAGAPWEVDFTSVDHNISHPVKVYEIHENGGYFVYPGTSLQYFTGIVHPELRNWQPYRETTNLRLYRPLCDSVYEVGLSNRRTLNLTATMGDLLFKLEPTILTPRPDITFIRLSPNRNYLLVIASDGLWDHLHCQTGVHQQNAIVMGYAAHMLDPASSRVLPARRGSAPSVRSPTARSPNSRRGSDAFRSPALDACEAPTLPEDPCSESEPESDYEPYQPTGSHQHRDAITSVAPLSPVAGAPACAAAVGPSSPSAPISLAPSSPVDVALLRRMRRLARRLAQRERNRAELFAPQQPRFDDVTVFVASISPGRDQQL